MRPHRVGCCGHETLQKPKSQRNSQICDSTVDNKYSKRNLLDHAAVGTQSSVVVVLVGVVDAFGLADTQLL